MLQGDLYEIVSVSCGEGQVYKIEFLPGSRIYKAHFPGFPITPGACILQIAIELAERTVGKGIMKTAKNVRFLAPVIPAEGKTADFTVVPKGDDISVTVSDEAVTYAKMSFTLE